MSARLNQFAGQLNYPKGLLAGQGIGAECARLFANEGAKVIVSDIDAPKAKAVAEFINGAGGKALAVPGDLLKDDYLKELVKKAAEFGGGKIHIIVNNAGFTYDGVIHKMTDKQWDLMVALHATIPFNLIWEAAPFFRVKDGEPRNVVSISSTSGIHGNAGQINYSMAKAGVVGMTKTIAKEWGPAFGVRANTVSVGHIETRLTSAKEAGAFVEVDGERVAIGIPTKGKPAGGATAFLDIPLRRPGSATEAASAILAIASPLSSYISGQTLEVTGGRSI
ncbi:hypothetical protein B0T18DRAFT_429722 [Schizothecium vesticola]|uniref:3-oxoacyl-[acyl-carrier-protein] reductase n=1 Tax=Schizothecium vesticola TaxID=314040 RepID=A0AA40K5M3_9PEZI|nr:hypothetical protein B0T18DRAFT_429722 [Schizothecium vesticola]